MIETVLLERAKKLYVLDVFRRRLDCPDLKRAIWQISAKFQPRIILTEDKASGTQLIQAFIRDGVYRVTRYEPTMDKIENAVRLIGFGSR